MFRESQKIGVYTLIRKLGQGGFGEVWLAENRNHSPLEKVAIKLPRTDQIDLQTVKDEIFNWILSGKHKNILPIIECETFGNQIAIVSEYAPDGSLQDLINKKGALPIAEAVEITIGILDGLAHLHNRKIIHRDLKPDNVLFQGNVPRLTDFGISRALTLNSQSQTVSGTFWYMSPETFRGKRNAQTDIWSVGVILYQVLTGKLPFPQRDYIELRNALEDSEPAPLPASIPSDLQTIVKKALAKELSDRYQTAAEMAKELREFSQKNSEETLKIPSNPIPPIKPSPKIVDATETSSSTITGIDIPIKRDESESNVRLLKISDDSSNNNLLTKICRICCIGFSVSSLIFGLLCFLFPSTETFSVFAIKLKDGFGFVAMLSVIFGLVGYYLDGAIGQSLFAKGLVIMPILAVIFLIPGIIFRITYVSIPSILRSDIPIVALLTLYIILPVAYSVTALIVKKVNLRQRFIPITALISFIIIIWSIVSFRIFSYSYFPAPDFLVGSIAWSLLGITRLPLLPKLKINPFYFAFPTAGLLLFAIIGGTYLLREKPEDVNGNITLPLPTPSTIQSPSVSEENILQIDYIGGIREIRTVGDLVKVIEESCNQCPNNRKKIIDSIRRINKSIYRGGRKEAGFSDDEVLNLNLSEIQGDVVFEVYDCCDLDRIGSGHFRLNKRFLYEKRRNK